MPGSSKKGKQIEKKWFESIPKIKKVLDIGPGWGTYSKLLRKKNQQWDAVEIFKSYIDKFNLKKYYDNIYIADIKFFELKTTYDVIICGDVLEHLDKKSAISVLKKLLDSTRYIIISLPLDAETNAPAGTGDKDWGNVFELHQGKWIHEEFLKEIINMGGRILSFEKHYEIASYLIGNKNEPSFLKIKPTSFFELLFLKVI